MAGRLSKILRPFRGGALKAGKAWEGASRTARRLRTWITSDGSPDGEIIYDLKTLRQRSRDLVRNGGFGRGAVNVLVQSVVGRGLKPQAVPDRSVICKFLNWDEENPEVREFFDQFSADAEMAYRSWAESTQCDVRGVQNQYGLQESALFNMLQSGDVFATAKLEQWTGAPYRLRIGLIEADQVETPPGLYDNRIIRAGVETTLEGRPIGYHVNKNQETYPYDFCYIPKFGPASGRQLIWHLFKPERVGQSRGVPFLAPVITIIKNKDRYTRAELDAAVNNSIMALFIKSQNPQALTSGLTTNQTTESKARTGIDFTIGAGAQIVQLREGEEIQPFDPKRPYSGYAEFVDSLAREIGMALNIPYEVLLRQFNSSYTASRAAMNQWERTRDVWRSWFISAFCQPFYREFITEEILSGRLNAPGFTDNYFIREAYLRTAWTGDSIGQIDPVKETQAAALRVASGFSTATAETAALTGGDYMDNLQTLAREKEVRLKLDVPPGPDQAEVETQIAEAEAAEEQAEAAEKTVEAEVVK